MTGLTVIMMIGAENQGVDGVSPEMTMTIGEAVDTVVDHVPDQEIGTVVNVNSIILLPVTHAINVMHPKVVVVVAAVEEAAMVVGVTVVAVEVVEDIPGTGIVQSVSL